MDTNLLTSIGLPVRNGEKTIEDVTKSVLRQDFENLELIISDNASTDGTEEICREIAAADHRVRYVRQSVNLGLSGNFQWIKNNARGTFFRWIGDDDEIAPDYVSRCVEQFTDDPRLILVTTGLEYTEADGQTRSVRYDGVDLGSDDPAVRFAEMLRLLTESYLLLDPLYGLYHRERMATVPYKNMVRGDELFAAGIALAGPWGHVPDVLGHRHWDRIAGPRLTQLLGVPAWQARVSSLLLTRELLASVAGAELTAAQRRHAQTAILRLYGRRHQRVAVRRGRKLVAQVKHLLGGLR